MRRWFLIAVLAISSLTMGRAQGPVETGRQESEAKMAVMKVENEMNQAILQKDAAVLARIYADDLIYINGRGEILDKKQAVEDYRSGNNTLVHLDHDDIRLRFCGNTIVLTGRSNSTVRYKDGGAKIPRRFTNVFVFLDGRWQIVSHQVTNVQERPEANPQRQ
jgi:ketosteroid isomerase-like protein